jgi:SRSO17 transposase
MFPRCRTTGEPFVMPTFDVQGSDVEGFMDELQEFQSVFHDCFARSAAREHFLESRVGPYSPLAQTSRAPMARAVEGGRLRSLQRFLRETVWDEEQRRWNYHPLVADELGEPDGVLRFDETGFVKQGKDSAGVARQYGGTLGPVEPCQGGGFAG